MAHAIVEYTDNIAAEAEIFVLLTKIAAKFRDSSDVFPIGGVRVRAMRLSEYVIADGLDDTAAFVNVTVKMGPGRPAEFKKRFFSEMFDIITAHLADVFATRPLAISLYVEEADEAGSFKKNNIHLKFKRPGS